MRSVMDRKRTTAFYSRLLNACPGPLSSAPPLSPPPTSQTGHSHGNALELICWSALPWLLNCFRFQAPQWFSDWRLQSLEPAGIPKGTCSKCKIPEILIPEVLPWAWESAFQYPQANVFPPFSPFLSFFLFCFLITNKKYILRCNAGCVSGTTISQI